MFHFAESVADLVLIKAAKARTALIFAALTAAVAVGLIIILGRPSAPYSPLGAYTGQPVREFSYMWTRGLAESMHAQGNRL